MNLFERNQISRRISRLFIVSDDHETTTRVVFNLLLLFFVLHDLPYSSAQMEEPPPPPTDGMTFGPRFNPSMAIIMVVLVSVFFLLGFFSVYVRRCAESRFPHQNTDPSLIFGGSSRRARRAGLDASVINTFPTFLYSAVKGLKIGKGTLECAVCLNEFKDDETLRLIPKCSHVFHPYCIDAWLAAHDTCPVCRANLEPEPGESISSVNTQILNPERSPVRPEQRSDYNDEALLSPDDHRVDVGSPPGSSTNPNRAPKSRSPAWKFPSLFPRSHSTGHSPVQPGEDCERFTLRLPEEVRSQLMNSTLNRTKSCVVLRSPRKGFRSRSVGFFYERFGRPSRPGLWEFCMTPPPLFPKAGSVGSPKATASSGEATLRGTPTRNLFRSVKSPFDRLCVGQDCDGERSFDRLRPQSQV